jgi:CubicO group peptidase (beta-lactamase class C family)
MRIMMAGMMCAALLPVPALADPIDDAFAPWSGRDRPGCAVAIAQVGGTPTYRAYGMADLQRGVPIRRA